MLGLPVLTLSLYIFTFNFGQIDILMSRNIFEFVLKFFCFLHKILLIFLGNFISERFLHGYQLPIKLSPNIIHLFLFLLKFGGKGLYTFAYCNRYSTIQLQRYLLHNLFLHFFQFIIEIGSHVILCIFQFLDAFFKCSMILSRVLHESIGLSKIILEFILQNIDRQEVLLGQHFSYSWLQQLRF